MTVRPGAGGTGLGSTLRATAAQSIDVTALLAGDSGFPAFIPQAQTATIVIAGNSFIFSPIIIIPIATGRLLGTASLLSTARVSTRATALVSGNGSLLSMIININTEHFLGGTSSLIADAEVSRPPGPVITDEALWVDRVLIKRDDKPRYHYS
jgi:hypothetical protein